MRRDTRIYLFHYRSERQALRLIRKLTKLHPRVVFTSRIRNADFRFYIWAALPDGTGGWVQRKTQRALAAVLPDAYNQNLLAEQEADSTQEKES